MLAAITVIITTSTIILWPLFHLSMLPSSPSLIARWWPEFKVGHPEGKTLLSCDTLLGARRSSLTCLTRAHCLSHQSGVTWPLQNQSLVRGGIILWPIRPTPAAGGGVSLPWVTCWMGNWQMPDPNRAFVRTEQSRTWILGRQPAKPATATLSNPHESITSRGPANPVYILIYSL